MYQEWSTDPKRPTEGHGRCGEHQNLTMTAVTVLALLLSTAVFAPLLSGQADAIHSWRVLHSHAPRTPSTEGVLKEENSKLTYSEAISSNHDFSISCTDFLGNSGDAAGQSLFIHILKKKYWLQPDGRYNLYNQVAVACVEDEIRSGILSATSATYKVAHMAKPPEQYGLGRLSVTGSGISYSGLDGIAFFNTSCAEFLANVTLNPASVDSPFNHGGSGLEITIGGLPHRLEPKEQRVEAVFRGISEVCEVNEPARRARVEAEDAARRADAEVEERAK
jgi:hypothetical protein